MILVRQNIKFKVEIISLPLGESWGMANDGEWRTPHFQPKWKIGHNENSLWQLLCIHSLVVCIDLGD